MSWRVAKSISVLLEEVNQAAPNRSKTSDGTIGDADHQTRTSDHNPWVPPPNGGVVTAVDITHDPKNGCDAHRHLAEHLRGLGLDGDRRVKYVISNRRIASSRQNWAWRKYTGSNPHTNHIHLSVSSTYYDDTNPWGISSGQSEEDDVFVVKYGDEGPRVERVQKILQAAGEKIGYNNLLQAHGIDGHYGDETRNGVNRFARMAGLKEEGNVGMDILVLDYCRNWLSG